MMSRGRGTHIYTRERTGYTALSSQEKRTKALASARESSVSCPSCGTQVMPADLLAHVEQRCSGPREPGPGARWVPWREAVRIVPKRTLVRWIDRGFVRARGDRGDRQYLYRDLAVRVSQMRGFRRR